MLLSCVIGLFAGSSLATISKIEGDDLKLDFGGLTGDTGTLSVKADNGIDYTGAQGVDSIIVTQIGNDSYFELGAGADHVNFSNGAIATAIGDITIEMGADGDSVTIGKATTAYEGVTYMNISCGAGADSVTLTTGGSGKVFITVDGFSTGTDGVGGISGADFTNASVCTALLANFGITGVADSEITVGTSTSATFQYDGNWYGADTNTDAATQLILLEGGMNFA